MSRELRYIKVCTSCFKTDEIKNCRVCQNRHVIEMIPAIISQTGEETFLEILA